MAAPGGKVGWEVYTHYVGNGADLQIEYSAMTAIKWAAGASRQDTIIVEFY